MPYGLSCPNCRIRSWSIRIPRRPLTLVRGLTLVRDLTLVMGLTLVRPLTVIGPEFDPRIGHITVHS